MKAKDVGLINRLAEEISKAGRTAAWEDDLLIARRLLKAGLLRSAPGLSEKDRRDRDLGKAVRGMEPGSLLYRGLDYWAHEKKARIGMGEIVAATPEAALSAAKEGR